MADQVNRADLERLGDAFERKFVETARCWMDSQEWLLREVDGLPDALVELRMSEWRDETAAHLKAWAEDLKNDD